MIVNWVQQWREVLERESCVLVTVVSVRGSAPRAIGAHMLVTATAQAGSIGGGNLEYEATLAARELLRNPSSAPKKVESYGLGPALNQCCGGAVRLLFERFDMNGVGQLFHGIDFSVEPALLITCLDRPATEKHTWTAGTDWPASLPRELRASVETASADTRTLPQLVESGRESFFIEHPGLPNLPLYLFGAGHVARAVVRACRDLPVQVHWIDSRPGQLPESAPAGVDCLFSDDPAAEVRHIPGNAAVLVMTHSHQLDEDICFEACARQAGAWLGLIGSETKRKRFVHRLVKRGIDEQQAGRIVCPVGWSGIRGKRPATIAVSIVAQLLSDWIPEPWR